MSPLKRKKAPSSRLRPPKRRQCRHCKEMFANPGVLQQHRSVTGDCRPAPLLPAVGMRYRNGAWEWDPGRMPPAGRMRV